MYINTVLCNFDINQKKKTVWIWTVVWSPRKRKTTQAVRETQSMKPVTNRALIGIPSGKAQVKKCNRIQLYSWHKTVYRHIGHLLGLVCELYLEISEESLAVATVIWVIGQCHSILKWHIHKNTVVSPNAEHQQWCILSGFTRFIHGSKWRITL